jgi:hypothetical protein
MSQKETRRALYDLKKEQDMLNLRYGGKLRVEHVPSTTSLKYIYLVDANSGARVAELNYRYFANERKLVHVFFETSVKKDIGLAEVLTAIALRKHADAKIISVNSSENIQAAEKLQSLLARLGYSEIVESSINKHFGFEVRKPQEVSGKLIEIQDAVGVLGMTSLAKQLKWNLRDMQSATDASMNSVLARHERRQFNWQSNKNADTLVETIEAQSKQTPQEDNSLVVGSNRLRVEADRVQPGIWAVNLGSEGHWHFTAAEGAGAKNLRAAWLVEQIRSALDFKGVPESRVGSLNGVSGVFTKSIDGANLADYRGHINFESVNDLLAFDFLVQHKDTHFNNFKVDKSAQLKGLDYESALQLSTVTSRTLETPFGNLLPESYSAGFISKLTALTPEAVKLRWEKKMTSEEMEIFLILREIILMDANNKSN